MDLHEYLVAHIKVEGGPAAKRARGDTRPSGSTSKAASTPSPSHFVPPDDDSQLTPTDTPRRDEWPEDEQEVPPAETQPAELPGMDWSVLEMGPGFVRPDRLNDAWPCDDSRVPYPQMTAKEAKTVLNTVFTPPRDEHFTKPCDGDEHRAKLHHDHHAKLKRQRSQVNLGHGMELLREKAPTLRF